MKKMQIKIINKKKMGLGIGLILLGLVSPALINVRNFHVYDLLYAAVYNDDTLALFISSIFLVLMNTLRIVPEYSGIFFSAESLTFLYRGKKNIIVPAVFAYTSMRLVYFVIEQIYRIRLDFGIPSLLVIALLLLFERINYQHIGTGKKFLIILLLVLSFQFLDVIPMLSSLHFGQGETAQDIKMTADYLGVEVVLGQIACIGFLLFFTIGVLIFFLLRGENHLRELYALREQNQSLLIEDRISKERSRFDFELRYLMHDLKSPLTSLQLLVSAFKMTCSFSEDDERWDQLENMEMAIHRMNRMVSEMQDSSSRFLIKTEELCATIMSETSITEYQNCIICENHIPNEYIDINQSLFCRAIINLFENAYSARRGDADFCILFTVRKETQIASASWTPAR